MTQQPAPGYAPGILSRLRNLPHTPNQEKISNQYYTPPPIIDAARQSMGAIDLDPASSDAANKVVKADRYWTRDTDGLAQQPWKGGVWLNPPFGGGLLRRFTTRLIAEHELGNVTHAACLTPMVGGGLWIDEIARAATAVATLQQHLPWWGPAAKSGSALAHVVWLLGDHNLTPWQDCPLVTRVWSAYSPPSSPSRCGTGRML